MFILKELSVLNLSVFTRILQYSAIAVIFQIPDYFSYSRLPSINYFSHKVA